jgi:meiosis-specific protein
MDVSVKVVAGSGTTSGQPSLRCQFNWASDIFSFYRCMGYHSTDDPRLPAKFVCYDCRLKTDMSWYMIKDTVYPQIMSKWRDFVTFRCVLAALLVLWLIDLRSRRAIKVAENMNVITAALFAKAFGE